MRTDHSKDVRIPLLVSPEEAQKIEIISKGMFHGNDPPHGYRQFYLRGIISAALARDWERIASNGRDQGRITSSE